MKKIFYNLATDQYTGPVAALAKFLLFLISLVYLLVIKILSTWQLRRAVRLNCKVISVGNITLGGTGKTTLVEYIAEFLRKEGHKVAILTRGYGRKLSPKAGCSTPYETMGDEPFMLASNLGNIPVIVDSNRIRAAGCAIRDYAVDTVILDDGLQQWRIKKDLEITAIDAQSGLGNRRLIPRGILREPLSALKRTDIFLFTKVNLYPAIEKTKFFLKQINPRAEVFTSLHQPVGFYVLGKKQELFDLSSLKGKSVVLFSGIGDPLSFENLILGLGAKIGQVFRFSDHYHYQQQDLEKIFREAKIKHLDTIITTEKDAARISYLQIKADSLQLLVLRIKLKVNENEETFSSRLLKLYRV
ncbi:MAG: tetraacyldisaccharide 4'-kinase [Candidatus Omnitrophica bacterium]|nr:tetraacyldisaccharide 4'-kinase [Candidatus Omnitrophota bacterium]